MLSWITTRNMNSLYIHICLLLLILMLWAQASDFRIEMRHVVFICCMRRIRTLEVWDTKSPAVWMPTHKSTELSRIKQNLNSIACPYDERAFTLLYFTAGWLSHLATLGCCNLLLLSCVITWRSTLVCGTEMLCCSYFTTVYIHYDFWSICIEYRIKKNT